MSTNVNGSTLMEVNGSFDKASLPDIHAVEDTRGIQINRVGVNGVAFPLTVSRKGAGEIQTLGYFDMYGSLEGELKGTNMSRFSQLLAEYPGSLQLSGHDFPNLLKTLATNLETKDVYIRASFDFWMNKTTPVSGKVSPTGYKCAFIGQLVRDQLSFVVEVNVPIATYCPCSKAMCLTDQEAGVGKGAHAQRGVVTLQVRTDPTTPGAWLEDLVRICETSGSAELYTLLKRPDEKFVTIQGYDNPKFVEDVARDVMKKVHELPGAVWAKARVRNLESIHPYDVTAYVCQEKEGSTWVPVNNAFY